MSASAQHRAIVEALGLSPADLRSLAMEIETARPTQLVRDIAQAEIDARPEHHRYVSSLHRLIAWAGDTDASTVTADQIRSWARRAGEAARTRANARHGIGAEEAFVLAVRAAYARANSSGHLQHNPAAEVDLPARPASLRTALTAAQLRQSHLALVSRSRDSDLDDLVFQLLRETACRRQGASGLNRRNVAPSNGAVRVVEKYGKDRWLPVSAHLCQRLVDHHDRRGCGCGLVLHRLDGGHLTDRWFEGFGDRLQRYLPWAAELGVTAHWLRHTTLTDVDRLAGVRVAGADAGHADGRFGVTGHYTKVPFEDLQVTHHRIFFDDPADAADPFTLPQLFRRVLPAAANHVDFATA